MKKFIDSPKGAATILFACVLAYVAFSIIIVSCQKDKQTLPEPAYKALLLGTKDVYYQHLKDIAIDGKAITVPVKRFELGKINNDKVEFSILGSDEITTIKTVTWEYLCFIFDVNTEDIEYMETAMKLLSPNYPAFPSLQPGPCPYLCDKWYLAYNSGNRGLDKQIIYLAYPYQIKKLDTQGIFLIAINSDSNNNLMLDITQALIYQPINNGEPCPPMCDVTIPIWKTTASKWLSPVTGDDNYIVIKTQVLDQ